MQSESKAHASLPVPASVFRKISFRLIPFLALLYFVAFLDRVNVGFAALEMNKDLGFSATVYGMGAGIFFIGYFIFEIPSNIILEKVGARRWIARIMVTWGIISGSMAFVQGETSFYILRFLLGVAEAGFFPGIILYLTYWYPQRYKARIVGAFMMAVPLSSVIGGPVSTALLGIEGFGLEGWHWLFILEAIPAVVLGGVVWFYLDDGPMHAKWLSEDERSQIVDLLNHENRQKEGVHHLTLQATLLNPRVWILGVMYFGLMIGMYGFTLWAPQMIKSFENSSNFMTGLLTAIPSMCAAVAMYFWGLHSDRTCERRWHVFLPLLVGGMGLTSSAFLTASPSLAMVALTIGAIGIYSALPGFWTFPTSMLSGAAAAGGIALVNSIGNLAGYFGPFAIGYMKDRTGSYQFGLIMMSVFMLISGLLALFMKISTLKMNQSSR